MTLSDDQLALAIAKKNWPYVGKSGSLIPNVAKAVAEGIKIGRRLGLELAAKANAEAKATAALQ
jgi:hypothetical protein